MIGLFALLLGIFLSTLAYGAEKATLILSAELKPYLDFAEGFRENAEIDQIFILPAHRQKAEIYLSLHPYNLVAVGSKALRFMTEVSFKDPLFYALIVSPEIAHKLLPEHRLCGLYLRLPVTITFPIIQKIMNQTIGIKNPVKIFIPYSNTLNTSFALEAKKNGKKLGVVVKIQRITNVSSLREFIEKEDFDVLYCIPDPIFSTEEAIALITTWALAQGKAVCGYNRFFINKGALIAFTFDYHLIGKATAQMWRQKICNERPAPFQTLINKKIFKLLKKKIKTDKNIDAKN